MKNILHLAMVYKVLNKPTSADIRSKNFRIPGNNATVSTPDISQDRTKRV